MDERNNEDLDLDFHAFQASAFMGENLGQWLSGRVLDSRLRGCVYEPHWAHWPLCP